LLDSLLQERTMSNQKFTHQVLGVPMYTTLEDHRVLYPEDLGINLSPVGDQLFNQEQLDLNLTLEVDQVLDPEQLGLNVSHEHLVYPDALEMDNTLEEYQVMYPEELGMYPTPEEHREFVEQLAGKLEVFVQDMEGELYELKRRHPLECFLSGYKMQMKYNRRIRETRLKRWYSNTVDLYKFEVETAGFFDRKYVSCNCLCRASKHIGRSLKAIDLIGTMLKLSEPSIWV